MPNVGLIHNMMEIYAALPVCVRIPCSFAEYSRAIKLQNGGGFPVCNMRGFGNLLRIMKKHKLLYERISF